MPLSKLIRRLSGRAPINEEPVIEEIQFPTAAQRLTQRSGGIGSMKAALDEYMADQHQTAEGQSSGRDQKERVEQLFRMMEHRRDAKAMARELLGVEPDTAQALHRMVLIVAAARQVGRVPDLIAEIVNIEEDYVARVFGRFERSSVWTRDVEAPPEDPQSYAAMAEICEDETFGRAA